jgi:hypothetical protein
LDNVTHGQQLGQTRKNKPAGVGVGVVFLSSMSLVPTAGTAFAFVVYARLRKEKHNCRAERSTTRQNFILSVTCNIVTHRKFSDRLNIYVFAKSCVQRNANIYSRNVQASFRRCIRHQRQNLISRLKGCLASPRLVDTAFAQSR